MVLAKTCYEHVAFDKDGAPIVAGTTMKISDAHRSLHGRAHPESYHHRTLFA